MNITNISIGKIENNIDFFSIISTYSYGILLYNFDKWIKIFNYKKINKELIIYDKLNYFNNKLKIIDNELNNIEKEINYIIDEINKYEKKIISRNLL